MATPSMRFAPRYLPDMSMVELDNWPEPWTAFLLEADEELVEAYFEQPTL